MGKAFSELLNWYGLVDEGVVLCKDGSLIAGWHLNGIDTEPMDGELIARRTEQLAQAIKNFDDADGFWVDLARRPLRSYRTSEKDFDVEVLQIFERERATHFEEDGDNHTNRITLCYQWQVPKKIKDVEGALQAFKARCSLVEARFSSLFEMTRMGKRVDVDDHHEIAINRDELLGRLASGVSGRFCKVNVPRIPVYLDRIFAPEWVHEDPKRLPVMSGRPVAIIAVDGYPGISTPEMLKVIESYPIEYQWTTRFLPMGKEKALSSIGEKKRAWLFGMASLKSQMSQESEVVNTFAASMADEAQGALDEVDAGDMSYGDFTSIITIFGDNSLKEDLLIGAATEIIEELSQQGFTARRETFNALEAFLSTLPGHRKENVRRGILSGENFTDLIPISTIWSGFATNPHKKFPNNSPALLRAKSITGEPYFFNLHSGDVGHTMVFGPTGTGKSVLLGLIASNFLKYPNAQVFCFDKMNSMYGLTRAIGGTHIDLGTQNAGLNPLGALDRLGIAWGIEWISKLCKLSNLDVTPTMVAEITSALNALDRNSVAMLDELHAGIQDENISLALAPFIKGGGFDGIINAASDDLEFSNFTVFEAAELLKAGEKISVPVLDYLFEQIEKRLTGAPTLIVMDEAASFLKSKQFAGRIETWFRELRKSNTSLLMATQFAQDATNENKAAEAAVSTALVQNCPTRIFLPDLNAKNDEITKSYKKLGLSEAQIDILTQMKAKRDYYVIKPEGRRVVDFCMGPKALSILGATDVEDSARIKAEWEKNPDTWLQKSLENIT